MTLMVLAQIALGAIPSAAPIADSETCYVLERVKDGIPSEVGRTWQTVKADRVDGQAVLRVLVHQRATSGGFDMKDVFVLRADTLQPISFENARNGERRVSLAYRARFVEGRRFEDDVWRSIQSELPDQIWEGNLFGVTFAGLPLEDGAEFELPYFLHDKGLGVFEVEVTGSEIVETPDGPVEAWVVDFKRGDAVLITYLIAKEGRRELGYRGRNLIQRIGGDCSEIRDPRGA
ncbi:MAG: hypothetical protein EON90_05255 [Brevundimonas sp.]|nr:MAG: hypothetical protein EON90_05255 [Brevundimonas sp.]